MSQYAKVVVKGSPITKSNFKLHNKDGRAILPYNTGKYHDRYALYEQEIAYVARVQNPSTVFTESLIAILKVYYKSEKRHPDTINISKSIFDGIEKSGLIINDAQIVKIIVEEYYDKEDPRFELELFPLSQFELSFSIKERDEKLEERIYSPIKKSSISKELGHKEIKSKEVKKDVSVYVCEICNKKISPKDSIKANKGKTLICKKCFNKLF
ncbi:RusA family crossover junction endodeoxyribonuclease [Clostridium sardiniense]|uniref:RusA family crossover junction endodeoxyribonuclease n=1 Tax=Clostridium sardiniense TaxID=29369 RepID=A0ABS7KY01_CLOSR|nr:RusA family crossover junction endodeoxyribonuclease [Clostridium sardiniense]MBY0755693.1 RusA family crossover junction endodeoxyribonuclease [Clostridium sardiniense]MDQ0460080.1 Holliday junction resolvase RusA-like endonuclease [Clostridium sardiniense]